MTSNELQVNPDKCSQCGHCAVVCPVAAIDATVPYRKYEPHTLFENSDLPPTVIELLNYYHNGQHCVVLSDKTSAWVAPVEQANALLEKMKLKPIRLEFDPKVLSEHEHVSKSRRSFLRFDKIRHQQTALVFQPPVQLFPDYQFYQITVNVPECTLCSACLRLCPVGAIRYEHQQFVIENGRCLGCGLCADSCPANALTLQEAFGEKTVSQTDFVTNSCDDCQQPFLALAAENRVCPACRVKRSLHISGSFLGQNRSEYLYKNREE